VVNSKGRISLLPSRGQELQKALLESEGVEFSKNGILDLSIYMWDRPAFETHLNAEFF